MKLELRPEPDIWITLYGEKHRALFVLNHGRSPAYNFVGPWKYLFSCKLPYRLIVI